MQTVRVEMQEQEIQRLKHKERTMVLLGASRHQRKSITVIFKITEKGRTEIIDRPTPNRHSNGISLGG